MSTELQRQASNIRKNQLENLSLSKGKPSLFLTSNEASKIDIQTIHEAAYNGLLTLSQYDSRFEKYFNNLLHASSINIQRELKTKEENKVLDNEITSLLNLLSLYSNQSYCHLVLEYLIRRYRIHELNVNETIQCMLKTHDTKIFARVIQLCNIEGTIWSFLHGVKSSGMPLPRSILTHRAITDLSILEALTKYVQNALDLSIHKTNSSIIIEMSNEKEFNDASLRCIYLFLLEGLKNNYDLSTSENYQDEDNITEQWRRSCCMILLQLNTKTSFGKPFMKVITAALVEAFKISFFKSSTSNHHSNTTTTTDTAISSKSKIVLAEILITMIVINQKQQLRLSTKVLKILTYKDELRFSRNENIFSFMLTIIKSLQSSYNISMLISNFTTAFTDELIASTKQNKSDNIIDSTSTANCLCLLLNSNLLESQNISKILLQLLKQTPKEVDSNFSKVDDNKENIMKVIRLISQRFALEFEDCVSKLTNSFSENNNQVELLSINKFLRECFSSPELRHHLPGSEGVGLLLTLNSAISSIRLQAINSFVENVSIDIPTTQDLLGLVDAVSRNLLDPIPELALAGWKIEVFHRLIPHKSNSEVLVIFQQGLSTWTEASLRSFDMSSKVIKAILTVLQDIKVLKYLSYDNETKDMNTLNWLFQCVFPIACGSFEFQSSYATTSELLELDNLSTAAKKVFEACSICIDSEIYQPFKSLIPSKSSGSNSKKLKQLNISKNSPLEDVVSKLAVMESGFSVLLLIVQYHYQDISTSINKIYDSIAIIKVVISMITLLQGNVNKQVKYLELICPLVLKVIDYIDVINTKSITLFISIFQSFIELTNQYCTKVLPSILYECSDSLSMIIESLSSSLSFDYMIVRIIVKILTSRNEIITTQLSHCLKGFPTNTCELLIRIVYSLVTTTTHTSNNIQYLPADYFDVIEFEESNVITTKKSILIDEHIKYTAMQVIASYLSSLFINTDTNNNTTNTIPKMKVPRILSDSQSMLLILLIPVVMKYCTHEQYYVREISLLLASRLVYMNKSTILSMNSLIHDEIIITALDIHKIYNFYFLRSSTIINDAYATISTFSSNLIKNKDDEDLIPLLCYLSKEYNWSNPTFTSIMISSLPLSEEIHLDFIVPCVLHMLETSQDTADGYEGLAKSLVSIIKVIYSSSITSNVLKNKIVDWIATFISKFSSDLTTDIQQFNKSMYMIKELIMKLFEEDLFISADDHIKVILFESLMKEQLLHSGQKIVLQALQHITVEISILQRFIIEEIIQFTKIFEEISKNQDNNNDVTVTTSTKNEHYVNDVDEINYISGLSIPLQRLIAMLEAVNPILPYYTNKDFIALGTIALHTLDLLSILNLSSLRLVMLVDYCKTLTIETACIALSIADKMVFTVGIDQEIDSTIVDSQVKSKKSKTISKKSMKEDQTTSVTTYKEDRVSRDVNMLLNCITKTKVTQVQIVALKLLKVLLHLKPSTVISSIETLGYLLSTTAMNVQVGKDGLLDQLLRIFVSFISKYNSTSPMIVDTTTSTGVAFLPQSMLQSLCENFYLMPQHRRSALLKMTLKILKDPNTLAIAINVLLTHSFAAYETSDVINNHKILNEISNHNNDNNDNELQVVEEHKDYMILLSKSSHRKAHKALKSSISEEYFSLATELLLLRSPVVLVEVLISLLSCSQKLLQIAIPNCTSNNTDVDDDDDLTNDAIIETQKTLEYACKLLQTNFKLINNNNLNIDIHSIVNQFSSLENQRGNAATIAVLHLEYILEVLENKEFHQTLVTLLDSSSNDNSIIQGYFLSLADSMLQLLAISTSVEQGYEHNNTTTNNNNNTNNNSNNNSYNNVITLFIEGNVLKLSSKALGKHVSIWCKEALIVLQKLMDGPSFVAILQELIDHEDVAVRQQALVILGERLQTMKIMNFKDEGEIDLYLDLNVHLRQVLQSFLPEIQSNDFKHANNEYSFHHNCSMMQSVLLCIDILARFLGNRLDWTSILLETLNEMLELCEILYKKIQDYINDIDIISISIVLRNELIKLLGSSLLCCATLSAVLGPKVLELLPKIMNQILLSLEYTTTSLLSTTTSSSISDINNNDTNIVIPQVKKQKQMNTIIVGNDMKLNYKTLSLLSRSAISAISIIITELNNFTHPYIPRILSSMLLLEDLKSNQISSIDILSDIHDDIDRCLSTIATKISPRLSVPLLYKSANTILAFGHVVTKRFAKLMLEVWKHLDRSTILAHLNILSTLATLLLDYRRVYGDQSKENDMVDNTITNAIVEFCLKLTETELKSFLTRLSEWRDIKLIKDKQNNSIIIDLDWRLYSRSVNYYLLIDLLLFKLKSLFLPMMSIVWNNAIDILKTFHSFAISYNSNPDNNKIKTSKNKKRLSIENDNQDDTEENLKLKLSNNQVLKELQTLTNLILNSISQCSSHDNIGFINEERYEELIPSILDLIPLLSIYENEEIYLNICKTKISPCLTTLSIAVGKDILWKPLNHQILLYTRDTKKAIRIASIKILHNLFSEIGEEYLLLLPECLPFLSELLEDANSDVVLHTKELIHYIEELSGEKLDEYLQ